MSHSKSEESIEHITAGEPNLDGLIDELDITLRDASPYLEQYRHDYSTRFCLWDGQSRDGKKLDANLGGKGKARPWNNASDVRTFTADGIVNEQVEIMMTAWRRANIQVTARQAVTLDWSTKMTNLLSWIFRDLMAVECERELELAANWRQGYGVSAMGIWWDQQRSLEWKEVRFQDLMEQALGGQEEGRDQILEGLDRIVDPLQEPAVIEHLISLNPVLDRQGARKFLRDLRDKGTGRMPKIYIGKNQPCWEALRLWLDLFTPLETSSFGSGCRWTARRRWITESQLLEKVELEGWDKDWAEAMVKRKGQSYNATESIRNLMPHGTEILLGGAGSLYGISDMAENYIEIFDQIYSGIDEDTGVPVLQRTVYSPHEPTMHAKHEIIGYDHKRQPFIELVRERVERPMVESRSIPEIAATFQNTIKTQRDSLNDLAQMSTIPTLLTPLWRSGSRIELGPTAQIAERTSGELRFLSVPQNSAGANNIEERAEIALAKYFGLNHASVPPSRTQMANAHLIGRWLNEVSACVRMTTQLCQQYMDDITAERVVGQMRVPLRATREEIQGAFNLRLSLDPNDLNFENALKKMETINKYVLPVDTLGVFNRASFIKWAVRSIDPDFAAEMVGEPEQAAQDESNDERNNLMMILGGIEPPMVKEGQNYKLRQQVLQELIKKNPLLPQIIQTRPDVQAMLEARFKHLAFLSQQFGSNAETGRVGAKPGLLELQEQGAQ